MKKIAIVCDSSVSLTREETEKYDVYIVPNVIMHNEKVYLDQVTITNNEIYDLLERDERLTTSQPSIGLMIEILKEIQEKDYDYTIIMSVSSSLSGGFNAFNQAVRQANLENVTIIDSRSIAGPVQQAVKAIRQMNENSVAIEEILNFLRIFFDNQISYLFPESLNQIVASGRLSKTAGKIASLLKVKVVLYLKAESTAIERLAIARTDKKIFDSIVKSLKENNVNPKTHDLYFLESRSFEQVEKVRQYIFNAIGAFNYHIVNLPASLSVHAGVGAIVVQGCIKLPI